MLTCGAQAVTGRSGQEYGDSSGHGVGGKRFLGEAGDEIAPSSLGFFAVIAVIQQSGGKRTGDGEEYQPISGGELEFKFGESWDDD